MSKSGLRVTKAEQHDLYDLLVSLTEEDETSVLVGDVRYRILEWFNPLGDDGYFLLAELD